MAHTRQRRWIEAFFAAAGAGLAAMLLQPETATWRRQVVAFAAAALPVLAIHGRHGQTAPNPPRLIE